MRRGRISYSAAEMQWLEDNRLMVISDYHRAFCAAFDRADVTAVDLHGLRKRKGWKIGAALARGRMIGRHLKYSAAEIAWLAGNATMVIGDYHRAFCTQFSRTDLTASALNGLRKRMGWATGRDGRFNEGSVSWNKGKKIGNNPGSARTQFKRGEHPLNIKYAGYEHVRTDGYTEISVEETNPHTGFERRMAIKHRWLWERLHGPIPDDMVLKCKGDKSNADPSNWELIPRALLPRLNGKSGRGYDEAPAELKPTIIAVAKLEHQIREAKNET